MEDWIQRTASHDDVSIRSSPSYPVRFQVPFHLRFISFGSVELNPHVKVRYVLLLRVPSPLHDTETQSVCSGCLQHLLAIAPCSVEVSPIYNREFIWIVHFQAVYSSALAVHQRRMACNLIGSE